MTKREPPKKPTRADRKAWALADELARVLVATCDLLDEFQGGGPVSATAVIERMQAYLDRRGGLARPGKLSPWGSKQPAWILRIRHTVARYESLKAHALELH